MGGGPNVISLNTQTLPLCCFFFGIAKQGVSYVVPVELRSVCEELCKSVVSRHSSYTHKTTRAFVQEKRLQYICFRFVLSSANKNNRADLIFDILAAATDAFVLSWDERFYCMLAKVRIPVIGRSVATVFAQSSSLKYLTVKTLLHLWQQMIVTWRRISLIYS